MTSLHQALKAKPAGPEARETLDRVAKLLSLQLKGARAVARAERPPEPGNGLDRARESLGARSWIALLPGNVKDHLLADLVGAQDALLSDRPQPTVRAAAEGEASLDAAVASAIDLFREGGFAAGLYVLLRDVPRASRSTAFERFAEALVEIDRHAAVKAYWLAYGSSPSPAKADKIARRTFKNGDLSSTRQLLRAVGTDAPSNAYLGELRLAVDLFAAKPAIPPRSRPVDHPNRRPGAIAYVASSALPYQTVGYTVRTHNLLKALTGAAVAVKCYVRPGYPWDRAKTVVGGKEPGPTERLDGVPYAFSRVPGVADAPEAFIERMTQALVDHFLADRPRLVHAASNNRTALPALLAARRLGIPFVYELRGLWELTAATKIPWWEETERFGLDRSLELLIAGESDQVLTITNGVADELVAGGIPRAKIALLPNAVDPDHFRPQPPDRELSSRYGIGRGSLVFVYCGSFTSYEGLDDLIEAVALLGRRSLSPRLFLVGDGPVKNDLRTLAAQHGIGSSVTFVDPVPPEEVRRYWSLADIVVLPRKPFRVCQTVSPLKPYEVMAMAKPVVLSDLTVSREIVEDGRTGFLARPADPVALAALLEALARDRTRLQKVGTAARRWVLDNRTWAMNGLTLRSLYDRLAPVGEGRVRVDARP